MITATDRMYYLDPLQSPFHTGTKVLVFRRRHPRPYNNPAGTVIEVTNRLIEDANLWWRDMEGNYVDGAVVSPPELASHTPTMGILNEDVFIIGESYGTVGDDSRMLVRDAVRSDNKSIPDGNGGAVTTYPVTQWLQAAPWAKELMPAPGDDEAALAVKVATAKQRFETRLAEICILREGLDRSWFDDVPELKDHGYEHLPTGTWALFVEAKVMVPTGETVQLENLPESVRTQVEAVAKNSLASRSVFSRAVTMVEVPAAFTVRTTLTDPTAHGEVSKSTIVSAAATQLGSYSLQLGSYTTYPVLRYTNV